MNIMENKVITNNSEFTVIDQMHWDSRLTLCAYIVLYVFIQNIIFLILKEINNDENISYRSTQESKHTLREPHGP